MMDLAGVPPQRVPETAFIGELAAKSGSNIYGNLRLIGCGDHENAVCFHSG